MGGATLLSNQDKGSGGIGCVKLLRYYVPKALRSNIRHSKPEQYSCVRREPVILKCLRHDNTLDIGQPITVIPHLLRDLNKNFKRFFTGAQNDKDTIPRPQGRGCHEVTGEGLSDKNVSEAHSKHLVPYCHSNLVSSQKAAFTLAECATHVDMSDNIRRVAFTLAEVLITLGIIGIVAALTIPTLITNYQKKVLKTQFMKKYAEISQVLLFEKNDFGENIRTYCIKYDSSNAVYINIDACETMFDKYFKVVGKCEYKEDVVTYNKTQGAYVTFGAAYKPEKLLSDGTCFESNVNAAKLGLTFDMNGADKGPNALGHDIFTFWVDNNNYLVPIQQTGTYTEEEVQNGIEECLAQGKTSCSTSWNQMGFPCNKASTQQGNGIGCSWYALHDVCPDDETQSYWDCLPK